MKIDAANIAKLANLPINDEDIKKLGTQLESTLSYIDQLNEIDTQNVVPTSHVTGLENITREDISNKSLSQKQALSNTSNQYNGLFKVKAILDSG